MLLRQLRSFQAIRKPGKISPAVFAFWNPGPPLRDFTKNIDLKAKPSLRKPPGLRAESFAKPMSSEPAPSHRPWISALGATPARWALPYQARLQSYTPRSGLFCMLRVRACRRPYSAVKHHLEYRNACKEAETGGCCRSTELVIVVPRPSWRNIFLQKTWYQQRSRQGNTRRSFGQ